jgi:peroxiredoxin Q/BCP
MAAEVGSPAPPFTLPSTDGELSLEKYRGQVVVLVFYPGDDTAVCTKQLNTYQGDIGSFEGLGAQLLGISPQSVESHEKFSCKQGGYGFPLLADEDKAVFKAYGCLGPLGFPRRSIFVIDQKGIVRYAHRALAGLTFRSTEELLEAIKSAG